MIRLMSYDEALWMIFVLLFPPLRPYFLTLSNVFYLFPSLPLFYLSTFLSSGPSQLTYMYGSGKVLYSS